MSGNTAIPITFPLKNATVQAIQLTDKNLENLSLKLEVANNLDEIFLKPASVQSTLPKANENLIVYQVIYPEDFQLKKQLKRGRPKNSFKRDEKKEKVAVTESKIEKPAAKVPRTRSGRVIKMPKHIEKDFAKILINDEPEVITAEFARPMEEAESKEIKLEKLEHHQRKRTISWQYRCAKCHKAYLGKYKMMRHIMQNPDHGPLPESNTNFDVWNYLVDITQKLPPKRRGAKFCEELTNLLHNVQLLTSALFKTVIDEKNCVQIDKVLGNAIGLQPGKYQFDENELYKDVTVLKLFSNTEFFTPKNTNFCSAPKQTSPNETNSFITTSTTNTTTQINNKTNYLSHEFLEETRPEEEPFKKINPESSPVSASDLSFNKKIDSIHPELLSENSLLGGLPNLLDTSSNLLDNSTSSDEVMNVDQFVNERFKKITEPDTELSNPGLNLVDLPSLDLFQFHTS